MILRPALTAAAADVLQADGYLLDTPANIGYMPGALKHFFDGSCYPCPEANVRRPYGRYVHGGMDATGAVRGAGARHRAVPGGPAAVLRHRDPGKQDLQACWELGALLAAEVGR